jgi:hypothetical protein
MENKNHSPGLTLNIDEGMPVVYWISAEAPMLLLGICVPAMLPLCRHLTAHYLRPLVSKSSSMLKSLSMSEGRVGNSTGDLSSGTSGLQAGNVEPPGLSFGHLDMEKDLSMGRQEEMLSHNQDEYNIQIERKNMSMESHIRVENDVIVRREPRH